MAADLDVAVYEDIRMLALYMSKVVGVSRQFSSPWYSTEPASA